MISSVTEEDVYSKTVPTKLTYMDDLESGELKKLNIIREYGILNRSINIMNHCGTHKLSSHCRVINIMKVLYNIVKHKHVKIADIVTENYIRYAKLKIAECKIRFGKLQIFDSSGENHLTRGITIRLSSKFICD